MVRFGGEELRALIYGAAYSYNKYLEGLQVTVPLAAFSDDFSALAQRFHNLLLTVHGSDPAPYGDFWRTKKSRASSCKREHAKTAFAFRELISPHVDKQLAKWILGQELAP